MKKTYMKPHCKIVNALQDTSIADIDVNLGEMTGSGDSNNLGDLFGDE